MKLATQTTRGRSRGGSQWQPRRVRSEEERGGGQSDYLRLDQGQRFLGYALFEGDPAVDEPGYYEYLEHFDVGAKRSIPCPGDNCPYCEDGDKPKVRAKTLWLVTRDENGNDLGDGQLRIFQANWNVIKVLTEMRTEGDKIKGVQFRVTRLDDRGNYTLMPKSDKLTLTQVKEHLKEAPDFDGMVTQTLRRAMEGLAVARALDDDDDDDGEPKTRASSNGKGKAPAKSKSASKSKKADWPDEGEDEEVDVVEVDEENWIVVASDEYGDDAKIWGTSDLDLTEIEEGARIRVSYSTDDEEDKVASEYELLDAAEPEPEAEGGGDLPDKIEGDEYEVVGETDEANGTIPVKSTDDDEQEFDLYILDNVEIDWDDYEVGTKIIVNAEKDTMGDMVSTEAPEIVKARATRSRTTATRKGASTRKAATKRTTKGRS